MTISIPHIIQFIKNIDSILDENNEADQNKVQTNFQLQKITRGTKSPNYLDIKQFCFNAKILKQTGSFLKITPLGVELFKQIESRGEFNKIIVEKCISNNYFSNILIPIFSKFHLTKQNDLWYETDQIYKLFINKTQILDILHEVNFFKYDLEKMIIKSEFLHSELVQENIQNKKPQSQKEIDDKLILQKKIGQIAEKFVLKFERVRLIKEGKLDQANRVKQISSDWANKGYDIDSFNGEGEDILPDRFIEVKGTSGKAFSIFWSENEISKAKQLGDEYWIYFVSEINLEDVDNECPNDPKCIQNPYDKIKPYEKNPNDEYAKKIKSIHVTKN